MNALGPTLDILAIGEPVTYEGLTMLPLRAARDRTSPRDYLTLAEATAEGTLSIGELPTPTVPALEIVNRGDRDVLIVEGEELLGGLQNRVPNSTVLVPAHGTLTLPVTCVEQGRWSPLTRRMRRSGNREYAATRAVKMASVSESLRRTGARDSAQDEIWRRIDSVAAERGARSATRAMADAYRQAVDLEHYEAAFEAGPAQVGAAFSNGHGPVVIELFERPEVFREFLSSTVRSIVCSDRDAGEQRPVAATDVRALLRQLARAEAVIYPGIGKGGEVRIDQPDLRAAALVEGGRVLHLAAFADRPVRPAGKDSERSEHQFDAS